MQVTTETEVFPMFVLCVNHSRYTFCAKSYSAFCKFKVYLKIQSLIRNNPSSFLGISVRQTLYAGLTRPVFLV